MFNIIVKGTEETVSVEFCILPKERIGNWGCLLVAHISHILALTQYAIIISFLCITHWQTLILDSECFKMMLTSCLSCLIEPVTEEPTRFYKAGCGIFSLINMLNSLYIIIFNTKKKIFRGKIIGITWHPSRLVPMMLVLKEAGVWNDFICVFCTDLGEYEDLRNWPYSLTQIGLCQLLLPVLLTDRPNDWLTDEQAQTILMCFVVVFSEWTRDLRWQDSSLDFLSRVLLPSMRS